LGGALFYLRVDLEIRRRTNNQRGLEMRSEASSPRVERSSPIGTLIASLRWAIARVVVPVIAEIYAEMKAAPLMVGFARALERVGVVPRGRGVDFRRRGSTRRDYGWRLPRAQK